MVSYSREFDVEPEKSPSNNRLWQRIESWRGLLFSRDTPWRARVVVGLAIVYLLSPFDLVPDWILGFGQLDDLTLVSLLVAWALKIAEKNKQS